MYATHRRISGADIIALLTWIRTKMNIGFIPVLGQILFIGSFIGCIMAAITNAFVRGVLWMEGTRYDISFLSMSLWGYELSFMSLIFLLFTACLIYALRRVWHLPHYHGPAETIYAAHRYDNAVDVKTGIGSSFVAFLSASGGASVGQYGPLVHLGASIGTYLKSHLKTPVSVDVFLGCGVAAAIAAGFNAPLAGMVFAHEVVLRHFSLRVLAPVAISSITAAAVSQWFFGDTPFFTQVFPSFDLLTLLLPAFVLGVLCGLTSVVYMRALRAGARLIGRFSLSTGQALCAGAFLCGVIGMFFPEVLGLGHKALYDMSYGHFTLGFLVLLLVAKILVTVSSLSFGFHGGVFFPAMFIGAALGGIANIILVAMGFENVNAIMVIAGMAGVAAPVFGAPITAILIVLELSVSYDIVLVAMAVVVTASVVGSSLFGGSYFDDILKRRNIDIRRGRHFLQLMEIPVQSIMHQNYLDLHPNQSVKRALSLMQNHDVSEAYVSDREGEFLGKIRLNTLLTQKANGHIRHFLDPAPVSIKHDASVQQAIEIAGDFIGESIPIINRKTNQLCGVIEERDLLQTYLRLHNQITDIEAR